VTDAHHRTLVAHADWSVAAKKCWVAIAVFRESTWQLAAPEPVGDPTDLLARLRKRAGFGAILAGFDFPIGVPEAYARATGIHSFPDFLAGLRPESEFWRVCDAARELSLARPFYPQRPGGKRQAHLLEGLGVQSVDDLRRQCERATPHRRAACPLFWTLGGNQVGKAAISGWRNLLGPALAASPREVALWPFDGTLADLIKPGTTVIAETYPAEFYSHLGVRFGGRRGGKRAHEARLANAGVLLTWARNAGVEFDPAAVAQLNAGFGPGPAGEDPFDATVGLAGMLNVLMDRHRLWEPSQPVLRSVEGWIFGQSSAPQSPSASARQRPAAGASCSPG